MIILNVLKSELVT